MNDQQYLQHNLSLLAGLAASLIAQSENLEPDDPLRELARSLHRLAGGDGELYAEGAALISRLFTTYPEFAPAIPRDLLWFLGGDCLHFMPDEEIRQHQQLDELRHQSATRGEVLDLASARSKLLKLQ